MFCVDIINPNHSVMNLSKCNIDFHDTSFSNATLRFIFIYKYKYINILIFIYKYEYINININLYLHLY